LTSQPGIKGDIEHLVKNSCSDKAIMNCASLLSIDTVQQSIRGSQEDAFVAHELRNFLRRVVKKNEKDVLVRAAAKLIGLNARPGRSKGLRESDAATEWGYAARTMRHRRYQNQLTSALTAAIIEFETSLKKPEVAELPLWRDEPPIQASPPASRADILIRLLHSRDKKVVASALSERIEVATNPLGDEEWRMQLEDYLKIRDRLLSLHDDLLKAVSPELTEEVPNRSLRLYQASLVNADFYLLHKTVCMFVMNHDIYAKSEGRHPDRILWDLLLDIYWKFSPAYDALFHTEEVRTWVLSPFPDWLSSICGRNEAGQLVLKEYNVSDNDCLQYLSRCDFKPLGHGFSDHHCDVHHVIYQCDNYINALDDILMHEFLGVTPPIPGVPRHRFW
jgi:hypothetical protein